MKYYDIIGILVVALFWQAGPSLAQVPEPAELGDDFHWYDSHAVDFAKVWTEPMYAAVGAEITLGSVTMVYLQNLKDQIAGLKAVAAEAGAHQAKLDALIGEKVKEFDRLAAEYAEQLQALDRKTYRTWLRGADPQVGSMSAAARRVLDNPNKHLDQLEALRTKWIGLFEGSEGVVSLKLEDMLLQLDDTLRAFEGSPQARELLDLTLVSQGGWEGKSTVELLGDVLNNVENSKPSNVLMSRRAKEVLIDLIKETQSVASEDRLSLGQIAKIRKAMGQAGYSPAQISGFFSQELPAGEVARLKDDLPLVVRSLKGAITEGAKGFASSSNTDTLMQLTGRMAHVVDDVADTLHQNQELLKKISQTTGKPLLQVRSSRDVLEQIELGLKGQAALQGELSSAVHVGHRDLKKLIDAGDAIPEKGLRLRGKAGIAGLAILGSGVVFLIYDKIFGTDYVAERSARDLLHAKLQDEVVQWESVSLMMGDAWALMYAEAWRDLVADEPLFEVYGLGFSGEDWLMIKAIHDQALATGAHLKAIGSPIYASDLRELSTEFKEEFSRRVFALICSRANSTHSFIDLERSGVIEKLAERMSIAGAMDQALQNQAKTAQADSDLYDQLNQLSMQQNDGGTLVISTSDERGGYFYEQLRNQVVGVTKAGQAVDPSQFEIDWNQRRYYYSGGATAFTLALCALIANIKEGHRGTEKMLELRRGLMDSRDYQRLVSKQERLGKSLSYLDDALVKVRRAELEKMAQRTQDPQVRRWLRRSAGRAAAVVTSGEDAMRQFEAALAKAYDDFDDLVTAAGRLAPESADVRRAMGIRQSLLDLKLTTAEDSLQFIKRLGNSAATSARLRAHSSQLVKHLENRIAPRRFSTGMYKVGLLAGAGVVVGTTLYLFERNEVAKATERALVDETLAAYDERADLAFSLASKWFVLVVEQAWNDVSASGELGEIGAFPQISEEMLMAMDKSLAFGRAKQDGVVDESQRAAMLYEAATMAFLEDFLAKVEASGYGQLEGPIRKRLAMTIAQAMQNRHQALIAD